MAISDASFTYNLFKSYELFKWMKDPALGEKIRVFSASLTMHKIIFLENKTFKNNCILHT